LNFRTEKHDAEHGPEALDSGLTEAPGSPARADGALVAALRGELALGKRRFLAYYHIWSFVFPYMVMSLITSSFRLGEQAQVHEAEVARLTEDLHAQKVDSWTNYRLKWSLIICFGGAACPEGGEAITLRSNFVYALSYPPLSRNAGRAG